MMAPNPRNLNLNAAYAAPWEDPEQGASVLVPQGNTQFDPFKGTGWGDWLDAAGAGDPGGVRMAPLKGLKDAGLGTPSPAQNMAPGAVQGVPGAIPGSAPGAVAGLQAALPGQEQQRRAMGMMKNQEQKAANFYPNATNYAYKPFGNY